MSHILFAIATPFCSEKSSALLNYALCFLRRRGVHTSTYRAPKPAMDLRNGHSAQPEIDEIELIMEQVQGVVLALPSCITSVSTDVRVLLERLPQNTFEGKAVLPLAIVGSGTYFVALDRALHPALSALGARHILQGMYLKDSDVQFEHGGALHLLGTREIELRESLEALNCHASRSPSRTAAA